MNFKEQQRQQKARELFKKPEGKLLPVDLSQMEHPDWMTRVFRNNRYCVMINDKAYTTHGIAIRCMVQRHDDKPIPNHWSELQKIKNEIFGKEITAIEYYPKDSELVDHHNIYWLWIYPEGTIPIPLHP